MDFNQSILELKKRENLFSLFYAKGANKLDDLCNKILTKFGFKKIWLEKQQKHIQQK